MEEVASNEIFEKLHVINSTLSPYGQEGWIKCEIKQFLYEDIKRLRSIVEAYIILWEEERNTRFSLDRFADFSVERILVYAPKSRKISISAYSSFKKPDQREIQGAFSKRIKDHNLECNLKEFDTKIRVILLKKFVITLLDLMIRPGNLPKKFETHPTPLLPPIAYCMVRLAKPITNEHLLDPMCGYGTIPCIAALEWKNIIITGADISSNCISSADKNAKILGLSDNIQFIVSNISELQYKEVKANIIVFNPPYGIARPTNREIQNLYQEIFDAAYEILLPKGRIIMITPYSQVIKKVISPKKFKIASTLNIERGELPRTIHIINKI